MQEYFDLSDDAAVSLPEQRLCLRSPLLERHLVMDLTQRQLSDLSGVPVRIIRSYEQGQVDITKASGATLYRLSRVLNCPIEELLAGKT